jgi:cellulose biosynthesis protein BcsQ
MGITCMALTRKKIDDDIDSLCSHLGLDPTSYHHFSNYTAPLGTASPIHEVDTPAKDDNAVLPINVPPPQSASNLHEPSGHHTKETNPIAIGDESQRSIQPFSSEPAPPADSTFSNANISDNTLAGSVESARSKLHVFNRLGINISAPSITASSVNSTPQATRWPSLRGLGGSFAKNSTIRTNPTAFYSVGGGVGLTTVLATTAKALGMIGQRVLVADDSPHRTLPLFFGAPELLNGINSLIVSDGVPTYLLLRDSAADLDLSDEWLWNKVAQLDTNIDALLMEANPRMAPRTQNWVYSTGVSIIVLEPDMRSAMALPQTLEFLAARKTRFPEPIATYFLLNKYDADSTFHVDMRRWLQDELDEMLVPVVLRRDYRVSEALAEGKTVLDYAPNSEIAQDFHSFAQWLRSAWKR